MARSSMIIQAIRRAPAAAPRRRGPSAARLCRPSGRPTPWTADADRHLLFGLLALQVGLIDQAQLVAAFHAWTRDKARPLADHLQALGHLDAEQRGLVEALAAQHLKKHDGDAEKSLAAVGVEPSIRRSLAAVADPEINSTLVGLVFDPDGDADPDRTASYAVGAATGSGQRFRVLRPHAQGGLAPSSWRGTRSCTARWR